MIIPFAHTHHMPKTERVTITLPADALTQIDGLDRNRSRFIAEAVAHALQRRRAEALQQSLREPHRETSSLIDVGLGDWLNHVPEDDTLLDAASGTPVRWIDGQGWVKGTR